MTGRGPRWRITSDGTPAGTRVHLGDVDVSHTVRGVVFRIADPNGLADVTVDLSGHMVDLDVDVERAAVRAEESELSGWSSTRSGSDLAFHGTCPTCDTRTVCIAYPRGERAHYHPCGHLLLMAGEDVDTTPRCRCGEDPEGRIRTGEHP